MSYGELFGPLVGHHTVEQAIIEFLKEWETTYLAPAEAEAGYDPETLGPIKDWATVNTWVDAKWPEQQLPCCLVISPGYAKPPMFEGDGSMRAWFQVGIGVVSKGRDKLAARKAASTRAMGFLACIAQHPSLGGLAEGVELQNMRTDDIPNTQSRTLAGGQLVLSVEVRDVLNRRSGPNAPREEPYDVPVPAFTVKEGGSIVTTQGANPE